MKNISRLCTRCKAEMTVEEWGEFLLGVPKEVKRWFADLGKDEVCHDPMLEQHSVKGSRNQPPKKEDEKGERNRAIQRVLSDFYGLRRPRPQAGGYGGPGAPPQQQGRHEGRSQGGIPRSLRLKNRRRAKVWATSAPISRPTLREARPSGRLSTHGDEAPSPLPRSQQAGGTGYPLCARFRVPLVHNQEIRDLGEIQPSSWIPADEAEAPSLAT